MTRRADLQTKNGATDDIPLPRFLTRIKSRFISLENLTESKLLVNRWGAILISIQHPIQYLKYIGIFRAVLKLRPSRRCLYVARKATSLLCDSNYCIITNLVPKCHCIDRFNRVKNCAFFVNFYSQNTGKSRKITDKIIKNTMLSHFHRLCNMMNQKSQDTRVCD